MLKTKLIGTSEDGALIRIDYNALTLLGWRAGDYVSIDIPMAHKNMLCIEKVEPKVENGAK